MPRVLARAAIVLALTAAICLDADVAHAAWPVTPDDNLPVGTGPGWQQYPAPAPDGSGGWYVVWSDSRNGEDNYDIYAQRIGASGEILWTTNGVPVCTAAKDQRFPKVLSDGLAGAIVTWEDGRANAHDVEWDIYAQRLDAFGVPQWAPNGVGVCTASGDQESPEIVGDSAGGAILVWADYTSNRGIYAERISGSGASLWAPNGVMLSMTVMECDQPIVVADGSGGAIASWWQSTQVVAQRVDGNGARLWGSGVSLGLMNNYQYVAMVGDDAGGAIVAWQAPRGGTAVDVMTQRLSPAGSSLWATGGVVVCGVTGDQTEIGIVTDGANGAILAWRDERAGASTSDIYAQRIDAAGASRWTGNGVAICQAQDYQFNPAVVADGLGGAFVAWADAREGFAISQDLYAQRVDAAGATQWVSNGVPVRLNAGDVGWQTGLPAGEHGAMFVWIDTRNLDEGDVYAQRVNGDGTLGDRPVPVLYSIVESGVHDGRVRLIWSTVVSADAALYRRSAGDDWSLLRLVAPDGGGLIRYVDEDVVRGRSYEYRLGIRDASGRTVYVGETRVVVPSLALAVLRIRPALANGTIDLAFEAPSSGLVRIGLISESGRRIARAQTESLEPGEHDFGLRIPSQLPSGVYFLTIEQADRRVARKVSLTR